MSYKGMDIERVRLAAAQLSLHSTFLKLRSSEIGRTINSLNAAWFGTDSEHLSFTQWPAIRTRVNAAVESLNEMAETLNSNADDQAATSSGGSTSDLTAIEPTTGHSSIVGGYGASGVSSTPSASRFGPGLGAAVAGHASEAIAGMAGSTPTSPTTSAGRSVSEAILRSPFFPVPETNWDRFQKNYAYQRYEEMANSQDMGGLDSAWFTSFRYQCTSWAVFRRSELGLSIPNGNGGEMVGPEDAISPKDATMGSLISTPTRTPTGHVMVVEERLQEDPATFRVSEMNGAGRDDPSTWWDDGYASEFRSDSIVRQLKSGAWEWQYTDSHGNRVVVPIQPRFSAGV